MAERRLPLRLAAASISIFGSLVTRMASRHRVMMATNGSQASS